MNPSSANSTGAFMGIGMLVYFFVPAAVPIVYGYLSSARRGKMLTSRRELWKLPVEESRARMIAALGRLGFMQKAAPAGELLAVRDPQSLKNYALQKVGVFTHDQKTLHARARFEQSTVGTYVDLEMWYEEFIISDTGEGAYIDAHMDALLADPRGTPPPVVVPPHTLYSYKVALGTGVLIALTPLAVFFLRGDSARVMGMVIALSVFAPIGLILPLMGFIGAKLRPGLVKGHGMGLLAIALTLAGLGFTYMTLLNYFPDDVAKAKQAIIKKLNEKPDTQFSPAEE